MDDPRTRLSKRLAGPRWLARQAVVEGLPLDPIHTGRAFGGLMYMIDSGSFGPDHRVPFWHTGGTPALFHSSYGQALQ